MKQTYDVIILAAGSASRFNDQPEVNKILLPLGDRPVFDYSLSLFLDDESCRKIWLVIRKRDKEALITAMNNLYGGLPEQVNLVIGGSERQDSVAQALKALAENSAPYILVHDAARPFIHTDLVNLLLEGLKEFSAVIPGIPAKDSMKLVKGDKVMQSLYRPEVRHVQTPQAFETTCLIEAMDKANADKYYGNEEGELVERLGTDVKMIEGLEKNLKITTPLDYAFARLLVEEGNLS
jgi:2-C-methyl-D-erythritol 4-phosphate cytidylyltransferase